MNVAPKKALGQHFLVDENILGVIGRLAELEADDVVLEIGPGLGGLTRYFAAYPGSPTLRVETYQAVVRDLLDSLYGQGFRR